MKRIFAMVVIICAVFSAFPNHSWAKETREQLLESALLNRYYPVIRQVTEDQFECGSVINIKRLGKKEEFIPKFTVTIQIVTFQGPHNPPNDLITITVEDDLTDVKVTKVERVKNVSGDAVHKACAQWNKKMKAHFNDLQQ
ncbi:DUF3888 domain-containing protein [Bacillus clarus]|uniref:DUF3888 domain-containing protein n=1 Tax=Bacillus clarus TaxID=2338372 RepID=A0A090YUC9_9BACI|nr:DUF3888 domain-containing protein [Bacillus clarus]KFN02484.1 hypothetical protein DJ93_1740 [Bacillus clarus]RFT68105.1 DUF3888 domain-containing protein [Bacillus clarus]